MPPVQYINTVFSRKLWSSIILSATVGNSVKCRVGQRVAPSKRPISLSYLSNPKISVNTAKNGRKKRDRRRSSEEWAVHVAAVEEEKIFSIFSTRVLRVLVAAAPFGWLTGLPLLLRGVLEQHTVELGRLKVLPAVPPAYISRRAPEGDDLGAAFYEKVWKGFRVAR